VTFGFSVRRGGAALKSEGHDARDDTTSASRLAPPLPLPDDLIRSCLLASNPDGEPFALALDLRLDALPISDRRGSLLCSIGHIAESVTEMLLVDAGAGRCSDAHVDVGLARADDLDRHLGRVIPLEPLRRGDRPLQRVAPGAGADVVG
jgi:hypothetical protein